MCELVECDIKKQYDSLYRFVADNNYVLYTELWITSISSEYVCMSMPVQQLY